MNNVNEVVGPHFSKEQEKLFFAPVRFHFVLVENPISDLMNRPGLYPAGARRSPHIVESVVLPPGQAQNDGFAPEITGYLTLPSGNNRFHVKPHLGLSPGRNRAILIKVPMPLTGENHTSATWTQRPNGAYL